MDPEIRIKRIGETCFDLNAVIDEVLVGNYRIPVNVHNRIECDFLESFRPGAGVPRALISDAAVLIQNLSDFLCSTIAHKVTFASREDIVKNGFGQERVLPESRDVLPHIYQDYGYKLLTSKGGEMFCYRKYTPTHF